MNLFIIPALIILTAATSAQAERYNPYGPEDPGYADAIRQWGKEILFAKYAARNCPEKGLTYNIQYFVAAPPDLWEQARFDKFMTEVMTETKNKLDGQQARLGREKFCNVTMEFFAANYKPDNRPVFINGK